MQNYKLNCQLGPYPPGSVVPEHVVEVGHDHGQLVARGLVEPTDLPVNVPLVVPKAEPEKPADTVVDERNRLAAENKGLRQRIATFEGVVKELEKQRDAFKNKCDEYTLGNEHLKAACEDHQKEHDRLAEQVADLTAERDALKADVATLTADLEKATAPKKVATKSDPQAKDGATPK